MKAKLTIEGIQVQKDTYQIGSEPRIDERQFWETDAITADVVAFKRLIVRGKIDPEDLTDKSKIPSFKAIIDVRSGIIVVSSSDEQVLPSSVIANTIRNCISQYGSEKDWRGGAGFSTVEQPNRAPAVQYSNDPLRTAGVFHHLMEKSPKEVAIRDQVGVQSW